MARPPAVCIVGAGAAGLSVAHELASRGWSVAIVEGGGRSPASAVEDSYRVAVTGTPHRGVHEGRFRALGGSTTRWGGQLWPWEPYEFAARPWLGIDGWPIGYDDIAPCYDRAFELLGLRDPTLTPEGAVERGVTPSALDPARFALKYSTWLPWRLRNLGRSIGRPLSRMPNVKLELGWTATAIEMGGAGAASGVRVRSATGKERRIAADHVVVAGGPVESVRLLFASGGLGNDGDWLGRSFMDHLSVRVARFHPRDANAFGRAFAPVFRGDVQFTPRMLLRPEVLERESLLSAYGHWDTGLDEGSPLLVVRDAMRAIQAGRVPALTGRDAARLASGVGAMFSLARGIIFDRRRYFPRGAPIHLRVDSEQRPDAESRLTETNARDAYGLPRLALDWRVSELERRTVRRTAELLGGELERAGIGTLDAIEDPFRGDREWGALRGDSFHMMGGTRMASVADDGVVDRNARVFGTTNVHVAGASIFPTGGMANPTLTLIALALRLASHLDATS